MGLLALISFQGFIVFSIIALVVIFLVRKNYSKRSSTPRRSVGIHYHLCLVLLTRRYRSTVIQEWVLDKQARERFWAGLKNVQKQGHFKESKKGLEHLNKVGYQGASGGYKFAGKCSFELCSENDNYPVKFTIEDYDMYSDLISKCRLISVTGRLKSLSRAAMTRASFRPDLFYKTEGLDDIDKGALHQLIMDKNEFSQKIRKINSWTPFEAGFIHAMDYEASIRHGSAEFVYEEQLENLRLGQGSGVFESKPDTVLSKVGVYVGGGYYYNSDGNFMTVGGTRSGKGVNLIVPQLLNHEAYDGSIISLDLKGTLTAITARSLKDSGFDVVILDPFGLQENLGAKHGIKGASFNPLDTISRDLDKTPDDCDKMARILVPDRKNSNDTHWDDKARQWVSTYLYHLITNDFIAESERNLVTLRSLFKKTKKEREQLFADMIADSKAEFFTEDVKEIADMFEHSEKEAGGILSSVQRELNIFKSPALVRNVSSSTFNLSDVTNGKMRLYLVIDSEMILTHFKWFKMLISCILSAIQRNTKKKVLLILDEFHSIGYMEELAKSVSYMPEFKLQLWIVVQTLSQLKDMYPNSWENFIANSAVTHWLGLDGNETPDFLSKLMSTKHVKYKPDQAVRNELENDKVSSPENYEIPMQSALQLRDSDDILVRVKGLKPLQFKKMPYYEDTVLSSRADPNPLREKGLE
tara:strand:- start:100722 stop:102812 length:2091 start_codon:yes stop_codon:yes gene_type:complete